MCIAVDEPKMKDNLIKKFELILKKNNVQKNISLLREQKINSYQPLYGTEYYDDLKFKAKSFEDVLNIKVQIIFVNDNIEDDLFDYFRYNVSSMPQFNIPGHNIKILVKDSYSGKYLGILQLSTDLLDSELKDAYIGIDEKNKGRLKKHIRYNSANLSICIPLQPFGFDFCGGKLLAMLTFSREIVGYYNKKYNSRLAMIVTTSIHGKSIQYDRIKQLKYIGLTHGYGTCHIDQELYQDCIKFVQQMYPKFDTRRVSKRRILTFTLQRIGLDEKYLNHGQRRGIYIGFTGKRSREFLLKNIPESDFPLDLLQNCDQICEYWKKRWGAQRYNHLH